MNKFDLRSMRLIGALMLICLIFALVVWQAFQYLPAEDDVNQKGPSSNVSLPKDEEDSESVEAEDSDSEEDVDQDDEEDSDDTDYDDEEDNANNNEEQVASHQEKFTRNEPKVIEPVATPVYTTAMKKDLETKLEVIEETPKESVEDVDSVIDSAFEKREQKNYVAAIKDYEKAIGLTKESDIKADCYEQIALIYATMNRFSSALPNAQKAYNLQPTKNRAFLLAKLNYKAGNYDKANAQIGSLMKSGFSFDDD